MTPTEQFGPYLVYEQLGIGGMASVHRAQIAEGPGRGRVVALKRMLPHVAMNDEMVVAFVREARLASHLKHKNVAETYELGRVGDIYFIAMELVVGRNLREILKHCAQTGCGPMPVAVSLNILNQICDALDYAHNLCDETRTPLGIIHRDVTPSNIIVSDDGVVKLIDFGIAKAAAAGLQTMGGTLKGKFGYMAPEYIAGSLDARADLFALGVIAHELLTNRPLFTGTDDIETLGRVQRMEIQPPSARNPNVPREIDDIVMTGLARDPNRRWQHATALRAALGTLTRRLGLLATDEQVVGWIAHAFDRTKPQVEILLGEAEDPSMIISTEPVTDLGTTELSPSQRLAAVAAASRSAQYGAVPSPLGTPSSMQAQASIPPEVPRNTMMGHQSGSHAVPAQLRPSGPQLAQTPEYQAAVARYERSDGRHPELSPAHGVSAADVIRQSQQRLAATPPAPMSTLAGVGARPGSNAGIALPPAARTLFLDPNAAPAPANAGATLVGQMAPATPRTPPSISQPPPMATPAPTAPVPAAPPSRPAKGTNWVLVSVLIVAVAAGAAAVVYFVLPHLT